MKRLFLILPCLLLATIAFAEDWWSYPEGDWPWGQELKKPDIYQNGIFYQIIGTDSLRVIGSEGAFLDISVFTNYPVDCLYFMCRTIGGDYKGDVVIPETVEYNGTAYNVTEIGYGAMAKCTELKSVTLPKSITVIYSGAFYNCTALSSITFYGVPPKTYASSFDCHEYTLQLFVLPEYKQAYAERFSYHRYVVSEIGGAGIEAVLVDKSAQLVECDGETVHNRTDCMLYVYGYDGGLKATIAAKASAKLPKGLYVVYGKGRSEKVLVK